MVGVGFEQSFIKVSYLDDNRFNIQAIIKKKGDDVNLIGALLSGTADFCEKVRAKHMRCEGQCDVLAFTNDVEASLMSISEKWKGRDIHVS